MNIQFTKITFRNILKYGNSDTSLKFTQGLNLVVGKNGTGKSTLLEAICFCLFGKPYRDIKIQELVNNKNKKGLLVTLEFTKGSDSYTIQRGLKPDILRILKGDEEIRLESHKSLIQEQIDALLGINYNLFRNIISLSSLYNKPFLTLPLSDRRILLENIFGLKVFGDVLKKVKKRLSVFKGEVDIKERTREVKSSSLAALVSQKKKVEESHRVFELTKTDDLKRLDIKLNETLSALNSLVIPQPLPVDKELEGQIVELEKLITSENLRFAFTQSKKEDGFPEFAQFKGESDLIERKKVKLTEDMKMVSFLELENRDHQSDLKGNRFKVEEFLKRKRGLVRDSMTSPEIVQVKDRQVEIKAEAKRLSTFRENLKGQSASCSLCGQEITESHRKLEEERVARELESLKGEFEGTKVALESLLDKQLALETQKIDLEIQRLEKESSGILEKVSSNEKLLVTLKETKEKVLVEIESDEVALRNKKNLLWEDLARESKGKLDFYKSEIFQKSQLMKEKALKDQEIFRVSQEKIRLERERDSVISEKTRVTSRTFDFDESGLEADIGTLNLEIGVLGVDLEKLKSEVKRYDILKGCLEDDGVRKYFFSKVLKTFNILVNGTLDRFGLNIRVVFNDVFEVAIKEGNAERSYESFSAGEQCRINLAITLSFMDLNSSLNSFNCNLQVFDEIFDSGMDDEGMEIVLEKMKDLSDSKKRSVFIISHKAVDNSPYVDSIVNVKKVNGFSKITVGA